MESSADAWLLFVHDDRVLFPHSQGHPIAKRLEQMVKRWRELTRFKGKAGEVTAFPAWEILPVRHVLLAGLGKPPTCWADAFFRAGGAAARTLKRLSANHVAVSFAEMAEISRGLVRENLEAFLCGVSAGEYKFARFLKDDEAARESNQNLTVHLCATKSTTGGLRAWLHEISVIADTLRQTYDIANLPGNEASPAVIAAHARRLAKKYGLTCTVWDRRQLERKGCGGILAVGRGSSRDARLIIVRYAGTARSERPIAFLGKTITFDTGGISLKPAKGMEWMKFDKSGGMAVLAATLAAARLNMRAPVIGILAAAENMPGGEATRPGDIIQTYSGKTVEILNTDAEGRLVLADALAIAGEYKPAVMIDLATLTGACIVALGHELAGLMANHERLSESLVRAGEQSGERLWPLPLLPEYEEDIKSDFADIKNIGGDGAGTIIGGTFLKTFVPSGTPWAHIDIAGTAYLEKSKSYRDAGATLFGARLLLQWLRTIQRKGEGRWLKQS